MKRGKRHRTETKERWVCGESVLVPSEHGAASTTLTSPGTSAQCARAGHRSLHPHREKETRPERRKLDGRCDNALVAATKVVPCPPSSIRRRALGPATRTDTHAYLTPAAKNLRPSPPQSLLRRRAGEASHQRLTLRRADESSRHETNKKRLCGVDDSPRDPMASLFGTVVTAELYHMTQIAARPRREQIYIRCEGRGKRRGV
ncbi:hypothetical protein MRX96_002260 [Rhipicephalus microplus]